MEDDEQHFFLPNNRLYDMILMISRIVGISQDTTIILAILVVMLFNICIFGTLLEIMIDEVNHFLLY